MVYFLSYVTILYLFPLSWVRPMNMKDYYLLDYVIIAKDRLHI